MAVKFLEPFRGKIMYCPTTIKKSAYVHYNVVAVVSVSLQRTQAFGMVDVIVVMISCFPSK
jgi:hypothetical protein